MKRFFLFTMMCLFGLFGSLNAQNSVQFFVGVDGNVSSHNSLPTYAYYAYSISQQIYTADEMQDLSGTLTSIAFRQTNSGEYTRNLSVYLLNVEESTFYSNNAWYSLSESDMVFSGNVNAPNASHAWMDIEFTTPFEYTGKNLLVCVVDNSATYKSGLYFDVYSHTNGLQALNAYRDNSPFNIASPGATSNYNVVKNVVKFGITIQGEYKAITINPSPVDLGPRPNGAWMAPAEVKIGSRGNDLTISTIETENSYFQLSGFELPATVSYSEPLTVNVAHAEGEGEINGNIAVIYGDARKMELVDLTAYAYDPVEGDVWETAEVITSYPFSATPDLATIYNNYSLPGSADNGKDVVYEMNLDYDVVLTANVEGENGKIAVYTEDFSGKEGPMADNNYNGPVVGSGSRGNAINQMTLPAGKYYVAASSTSEFTVNINVEAAPTPEKAYGPYPQNYQKNVTYPEVSWTFGANTVEYQVLFGTQYPPQNVLVDWTNNLENKCNVEIANNKNYFWQVNVRNTSGTTYGDVWAFTTAFDKPQDVQVSNDKLYEGETTEVTWTGTNNRSFRGYNIYVDSEKINKTLVTDNSYVIEGLEYNMSGWNITVTAVYDEGESSKSNVATVKVTGMSSVSGNIYEQDGATSIGGGTVTIAGNDEHGVAVSYTFEADANGAFGGEILAGSYVATVVVPEYQNAEASFTAAYGVESVVNISMYEFYYPVKYVTATVVSGTAPENQIQINQIQINQIQINRIQINQTQINQIQINQKLLCIVLNLHQQTNIYTLSILNLTLMAHLVALA